MRFSLGEFFGLSVRRKRVSTDFGRVDPIHAWYKSRGRYFRLTVDLDKCLTFRGSFRCSMSSPDPLAATLMAIDRGECRGYEASPFQRFHDTWQPATIAESLGIDSARLQPNSRLLRECGDPQRLLRSNFKKFNQSKQPVFGALFYGPASLDFGEATVQRALHVREKIRRDGFVVSKSSLTGRILVDDNNDWRIFIVSGKHTAAALVSLGHTEASIVLGHKWPPIKYRSDASRWPEVVAGDMPVDDARDHFDRMFAFRQPAGCVWRANDGTASSM
jgi:hypothetical protein